MRVGSLIPEGVPQKRTRLRARSRVEGKLLQSLETGRRGFGWRTESTYVRKVCSLKGEPLW